MYLSLSLVEYIAEENTTETSEGHLRPCQRLMTELFAKITTIVDVWQGP